MRRSSAASAVTPPPSTNSRPIEVEYFQVLHDRLILQHNKKAWNLWHEDVEGNLKKADTNWPTLSQQKAP